MRGDFVKENSQRRQEKINRDQEDKRENQEFKIDFFPFTHGEQIENRRLLERQE